MPTLTVRFHADGNTLTLISETPSRIPFAKPSCEVVRFEDWIRDRPASASAALARLLQAKDDGETGRDGTPLVIADVQSAQLHPDFVARLNDSEAQGLGLPPTTRLALNLRSAGLIHKDGFRIDTNWSRGGGVPVQARAGNGLLRHQSQVWRIPEPLWSTLGWVQAVNCASNEAERQSALSELKRTIGEDATGSIRPDGKIERLRLHYAAGFSISINPSATGIDFEPVLFSRERITTAEDGTTLDEEADGLLPPILAKGFTQRFRASDGQRRSYLLPDGSLLFIDPELSRVLGIVRKAQGGTPSQRRAFVAEPQRHISEALGSLGDGAQDARLLFVETQQFSQRVAGIDIWRKPVLPWIKPKPGSWLPESFGLRVGDPPDERTIAIPPDQLEYVSAAAHNALRLKEPTFEFAGETIPATQATVSALASLAELGACLKADTGPTDPPRELRERFFLQVQDNLESVDYAPLVGNRVASALPLPEFPPSLRTAPKPHQVDGFRWLAASWRGGNPGALLADDMGLGKTWQALAFLAWVRSQEVHPRPVLIVAPTGLLANWRAEIARHLQPDALGRVVGAYGSELARMRGGAGRDTECGSAAIDGDTWSHSGVVLTTFETMRDYHMSFARQPFAVILYDEAQKLKNPASQVTRAAKTLNARFQLALTGTPVENRLQDLWSIIDVIHPGLLGSSKSFEQTWSGEPEKLAELHQLLTEARGVSPPILLRRLKEECLGSLPAKHVRTLPLEMPPTQVAAYDKAIARAMVVKGTGQRGRMLEVLHQLRGLSLHPFHPEEAGSDPSYFSNSARLETLFKVLAEVAAKQEKALIFCESLAMQVLLATEIRRRFSLPHSVARIHGGVTGDARQKAVDIFQERGPGFDAMILSPKAGGVGLTLTAANHVIHLSRWWNPAVEDQATDRVYRIGQTREVTVYLPQAVHPHAELRSSSFDLRLHDLMERKRALSRGLFAPADDEAGADALFDSVVVEKVEPAEVPVGEPVAPVSHTQSQPQKSSSRTILGVRLRKPAPDTPPSAPPTFALPTWPSRIVYDEGGLRDRTIFTAPLAGEAVDTLTIIDPYAAAGDRARRATVDFARMLLGDGTTCSSVKLITLDAESVSLAAPEDSNRQYDDMLSRWEKAFGRVALHYDQLSKQGNRSLHDREVRATTRSGRTIMWDLGHGIEGVMTARYRCVVNLTVI